MARPTKYQSCYAVQAGKLCALGATDRDLATFFEVALSTIYLWQIKYKLFSDAIRVNKPGYDDKIERAFAHRAMGFQAQETKKTYKKVKAVNDDGEEYLKDVLVETVVTEKNYPPDTKAAIIWLANRRGKEWQMVQPQGGNNKESAEPQKVTIEVVDARKKDND